MSTLKANYLQNPSATTANIVLNDDGSVANAGGQTLAPANRNLLYNGAMQVAQRNTTTTAGAVTAGGYYTADRWTVLADTFPGAWTQSVENDAPTGSGLRKSLKMACSTAKTTLTNTDILWVAQRLEGQDVQRIKKGTSSAQQLTLSFWVKTNVTGTYVVELNDVDNTRHVTGTYAVAAGESGTWVKRTITFAADTSGAFDNDNASSLQVMFVLAAGSSYSSGSLPSAWASVSAANRGVGNPNVTSSTSNYWQVTGVQLEVGAVATSFEFEDYGTTLRKCQRYYYRIGPISDSTYARFGLGDCVTTVAFQTLISHPTPLRAKASAFDWTGTVSNYAVYHAGAITPLSATPTIDPGSSTALTVFATTVASGLTAGRVGQLIANNNSTAYLGLSAEL